VRKNTNENNEHEKESGIPQPRAELRGGAIQNSSGLALHANNSEECDVEWEPSRKFMEKNGCTDCIKCFKWFEMGGNRETQTTKVQHPRPHSSGTAPKARQDKHQSPGVIYANGRRQHQPREETRGGENAQTVKTSSWRHSNTAVPSDGSPPLWILALHARGAFYSDRNKLRRRVPRPELSENSVIPLFRTFSGHGYIGYLT